MTLAQASHEEQLECYFEKLVAEFVSACASTPDVTQAVIVEGECRSSLMRMKEMERQHQARIEEAAEAYQILQRTLESKDDQNNKLQARNAELEGKIERIQQELFGGGHPERGTNDRSQDNAPDELNVVNNIRPQPKKHGGGRPRKVKKTRPPGAGRQPKMIES